MAAKDILRKVRLVFDRASGKQVEDESKKSLSGVEAGLNRIKKLALGVGSALAVAFGVRALVRFGKESVRIAAESEAIWTRLGHAVENVGVSFAQARPQVAALARAMQDVTKVGDEDFASILTELITFSGDYARSLANVGVVADLAAAKQLDFRTAAQLVGKAMIGEVSTLKRYGVVVKEGEDAIEALRKQFRGFAQSEARTWEGKVAQLANEWGDFRQAIGEALIAGAGGTSILDRLIGVVKNLTTWVDANKLAFERWGNAFVDVLDRVGRALQKKMDQLDPLGKKERENMEEILRLREDEFALAGKRFQLGQEILRLAEQLTAEEAERARLQALVDAGRMTPLAVRQANFRIEQLEKEIEAYQRLILAIDDLDARNAPAVASGTAPAGLLTGGGGAAKEPPNLGALTFSMGTPPLGTLEDAKELSALWEQYPALLTNVNAQLSQAESLKEGWAGLNSEMEMGATNAALLAASVEKIGEAAVMSQVEMMALNAAADLGGTLMAAVFGSDLGKLAAMKAEQNAIMAAEQLAMAAAVAWIPGFQGEAAGHIQAAAMFAGVAAAWGALAGVAGGFSGGGGGAQGGPRDVGGAASERAEPPGPEVHIYMEGDFDALNPRVQRVIAGAIKYSGETYGKNAVVNLHRRGRR